MHWYYLIGGVLGAAYVTTVLLTVRTLGAGGVTAATVAGQLTMSVVIDRLGFLGLEETPITLTRVIGVLLLFAGTRPGDPDLASGPRAVRSELPECRGLASAG